MITLDEALAQLQGLGSEAGLASAAWLVLRLDELSEGVLNTPRQRCGGQRCEVTSFRARQEQGCVCEQTTLACRLWERAFPETLAGTLTDARKRKYQRRCPGCRLPFVTGEKAQRYCTRCLTAHAPAPREEVA